MMCRTLPLRRLQCVVDAVMEASTVVSKRIEKNVGGAIIRSYVVKSKLNVGGAILRSNVAKLKLSSACCFVWAPSSNDKNVSLVGAIKRYQLDGDICLL